MSQIILDFGSGNTCQNNYTIVRRMIDELKAVDTGKHEVVIKWQLFEHAGDNVPLDTRVFAYAYRYAEDKGYKTTSSVFDLPSLKFLLWHDVPFIKIANNRSLDWLIGEIPRKIPVYVSVGSHDEYLDKRDENMTALYCISKYPATLEDYENEYYLPHNTPVSDHTIGLELFKKYQPAIWEKHYKLPDSTGLDAGPFAITPEELKEIL